MISVIIPGIMKRPRRLWLTGALFLFVFLAVMSCNRNSRESSRDPLTPRERSWLKAHPVIRLAPDPDFPPVEFFAAGGAYSGMIADYVALIEKKLGIRFEIVRLRNWDEVISKAKNGQIDAYVATKTPQREKYLLFTRPFLEFPVVIIAREKAGVPLSLDKLDGMKVSVVSEYATHNFIAQDYPELKLEVVPDVGSGLERVSFGLSDAFVENLATATYYIEKKGISNLRIAGESGYFYRLGFCTRKDWPELNSILEKGLAGISDKEKRAIYRKWIPVEPGSPFAGKAFQRLIIAAFALILLFVMGVTVWNRALARQVRLRTGELENELAERRRVEEELHHARDDLEKQVEERTAELAMTAEALIAAEREKSLFLNVTDALVLYYDTEMKIQWANRAACESVDMTEGELRVRRCWEIWHQRREPCAGCPVILTRDTGEPQETEMCSPDGRVWFIRGYPVKDKGGRLTGMVEFCQDITERKLAEDSIRESREKYQAIVDSFDGLIYICSQDCRIEFMNRKLIERTGGDAIGERCYQVMHGLDSVCPWCANDRVFAGETFHRDLFSPRDNRWYEVLNVPIRNADGSMSKHAMMVDITERKLFEEELKRQKELLEELNDTLERRVGEEVRANREKDIMLIQQNRQAALGEMLDHIAHQWKQPLNSISLIVQELEEASLYGELTNEIIGETVSKTIALVQHMAQTIDTFRGFYRPDKEKKVFNIKESIDQALAFIAPAFRFHSVTVELDVDPGLTAFGYPKEYSQVLLNILANARDIFLARKTEKPRVILKSFADENKAVVTIEDNGGGIPEQIRDRIFDFYFTTNESGGGTGLGLYMSKNIIEKNMAGSLQAENADTGALFRIEIPAT